MLMNSKRRCLYLRENELTRGHWRKVQPLFSETLVYAKLEIEAWRAFG